jgi:LAS superfamily LD-carboxypeptidase LdcB
MRVVEPRQFHLLKKKKPKRRKNLLPFALVVIAAIGLWVAWQNPPKIKRAAEPAPKIQPADELDSTESSNKPRTLKIFTGEDFKILFRSLAHPNTQSFLEPPSITGNIEADNRIRMLAEERGYRLTSIPVNALIRTEEDATVDNDDLLQPLAYQGWVSLKDAAKKEGIPLSLYSGYRSPEFQRDIFMERLLARGATPELIAAGRADAAVRATLEVTAVPGYSRHHGGYTADFQCDDGSLNFGASVCFVWLNANNYQHAKEHGWIPSYPEEAQEQGPEPEPWEYIWVGLDALSQ